MTREQILNWLEKAHFKRDSSNKESTACIQLGKIAEAKSHLDKAEIWGLAEELK